MMKVHILAASHIAGEITVARDVARYLSPAADEALRALERGIARNAPAPELRRLLADYQERHSTLIKIQNQVDNAMVRLLPELRQLDLSSTAGSLPSQGGEVTP